VASPEPFLPALRFERLTPLYDAVIALTTRERTFRPRLVEQAAIADGMSVLDVGAGTGTLAALVNERHAGTRVTGLDADPAMLERARLKAPRASFDEGMSYALPYPDASFDRVLSSLFFHHLRPDDKRRTLSEIHRVLRPGGELHVADWGRPAGALSRVLALSIRTLDGPETTTDSLAGRLPELVADAGFEDVRGRGAVHTAFGTLALISASR
jgi:ubiquinone/menaquinone biosynthesis C-methylase UbiE